MKLSADFYQRNDVLKIAQQLIGKGLFTNINGIVTGGIIVETEAYSWQERGCHAYGSKKTQRNAVMFGEGGVAYVYLCYGMHNLVNIVTNKGGVAEAVLIRALEPLVGVKEMQLRRGLANENYHLTSGPGKLTKALGISRTLNGKSLLNDEIWVNDLKAKIPAKEILASPRIGIEYAGDDAALPWRFTLKGNKWVSK